MRDLSRAVPLLINRLEPGSSLPPRPVALYSVDVSRVRFIPPALATLRASPPAGERWQYDLKFDGYRVQLHKASGTATMYGKNDLTRRIESRYVNFCVRWHPDPLLHSLAGRAR